jgi:putative ABC transport system ATP-binding protein
VAIARALVNRPALILADEPTGNLDSKAGEEILGIFQDLVAGGATIVMVTHNLRIAEQAPRVIQLEDGRITSDVQRPPPRRQEPTPAPGSVAAGGPGPSTWPSPPEAA